MYWALLGPDGRIFEVFQIACANDCQTAPSPPWLPVFARQVMSVFEPQADFDLLLGNSAEHLGGKWAQVFVSAPFLIVGEQVSRSHHRVFPFLKTGMDEGTWRFGREQDTEDMEIVKTPRKGCPVWPRPNPAAS